MRSREYRLPVRRAPTPRPSRGFPTPPETTTSTGSDSQDDTARSQRLVIAVWTAAAGSAQQPARRLHANHLVVVCRQLERRAGGGGASRGCAYQRKPQHERSLLIWGSSGWTHGIGKGFRSVRLIRIRMPRLLCKSRDAKPAFPCALIEIHGRTVFKRDTFGNLRRPSALPPTLASAVAHLKMAEIALSPFFRFGESPVLAQGPRATNFAVITTAGIASYRSSLKAPVGHVPRSGDDILTSTS